MKCALMLLVDARRLTGPNLLAWEPLVVVELALDVPDLLEHACEVYLHELARIRSAVGFSPEVPAIVRPHHGGAVIAYPAPIDVMLACTEMSEWAALSACEVLGHREPFPLEKARADVEGLIARDRSPRLLAIEAEARTRGVPFLWDDDLVSIGCGPSCIVWPRSELPDPSTIPWESVGTIPIAMVTGTNGKTTTVRLLSRMAREAGLRVGTSSSDGVVVNGDTLETGDWTGPAAARLVLRRSDIDIAVLETARGGLLRRGLAIDTCSVAVITNVSQDHTGGYGIDDLHAMTNVKGIIARAAKTAVLNARDPKLVALATSLPAKTVFFADADDASLLVAPRVRAEAGTLYVGDESLLPLAEIPITFGGAARYVVENVAGAVAAALELGLPREAIVRALRSFEAKENPGRGVIVEKKGVRVMLDFGHNPAGVRAVLDLVTQLRGAGRLIVIAGSAGDRSNDEIDEMARAIAKAKPDRVLVRDLPDYLRGRLPGEVPALFRRLLDGYGVAAEVAASEVDALSRVLDDARPNDFALLLVHLDRDAVAAFLDRM
jgi:cyanophycin synthetase